MNGTELSELKGWIEAGFKDIARRFDAVDTRFDALEQKFERRLRQLTRITDRKIDRRFRVLQADINSAHVQFDEIKDLLGWINEGESPALAHRMEAIEVRVSALERKRR